MPKLFRTPEERAQALVQIVGALAMGQVVRGRRVLTPCLNARRAMIQLRMLEEEFERPGACKQEDDSDA